MINIRCIIALLLFCAQSSSAATIYEFIGNDYPSFYFDISSDGEHMISSSDTYPGFKFHLYDLKNQEAFWFPHNVFLVSPVFTPDSKYLVFPDARLVFGDQVSRQRFYNFSDFKADTQAGRFSKPLLIDGDYNSFFYSVGQYLTPSQQLVSRIFGFRWLPNDDARFVFRDYAVNPITGVLEPYSDFKEGCFNVGHSLGYSNWLFTLSKNGQLVVGDNLDDERTDLFEINSQDGGCKFVISLPRRANKVSFNYSNNKVLYTNYWHPQYSLDEVVLDVYEYDLVSGEERRITNHVGNADSFNPQYDYFGNIYYLKYSPSRVTLEKESGR